MRCILMSLLLLATSCGRVGFDYLEQVNAAPDASGRRDAAPTLTLSAPADHLNFNSSVQLLAAGGLPPYIYEKLSGAGILDTSSGRYRSSGHVDTAVLRVSDQTGASADLELPTGGQKLFFIGGRVGTNASTGYVDTVWRSSDGGAQWESVGTLPAAVGNSLALVVDDTMFVMGGRADSSVWHDEIWRSTDGVTWSQIGTLPAARAAVTGAYFRDRFVIIGGYNQSPKTNTWSSADGVDWRIDPEFPLNNYGGVTVIEGAELHHFGGVNMDRSLYTTTDGLSWTETINALPTPCNQAQVARINRSLYYGASANCPGILHSSDLAQSWPDSFSITPAAESPGLAVLEDKIIMAGGTTDIVRTSVDGESWTVIGALPAPRNTGRMLAFTPR